MVRLGGAFVIVLAALGALYFSFSHEISDTASTLGTPTPHLYGSEATSLKTISLVVLYLVPRDKKPFTDWESYTKKRIAELETFHQSQFSGTSAIEVTYLDTPLVGSRPSEAYEVDPAHHTDAAALSPIRDELTRLLADGSVAPPPEGAYRNYLVVLEGTGAAGSGNLAMLSRSYLTDPANDRFAATMLAHEFYHTLGIPDGYDTSSYVYGDAEKTVTAVLTSDDIMGRVRVPLPFAYLERRTITAMGL